MNPRRSISSLLLGAVGALGVLSALQYPVYGAMDFGAQTRHPRRPYPDVKMFPNRKRRQRGLTSAARGRQRRARQTKQGK